MTRAASRHRGSSSSIRVGRIESYEVAGWHGVRADVDGEEILFEAEGVRLAPAPEAFASSLLVAALEAQRGLALDAPVDRQWLHGAAGLMRVFSEWWGYRPVPIEATERDGNDGPTASGEGLCFSGGADSFHALLRSPEPIDTIVSVQGFDMAYRDERRWATFSASLDEIAKVTGVRSVRVRTNLRQHPSVKGMDWERGHGGALAALGHLLSGSIGRLVIASSIPAADKTPWGSHWQTDALWSSSTLTVVPWGEASRRDQKIREICREPLVQAHLRVCWENRAPTGNCSRCVKCLRTVLLLLDEGVLDRYPGFASAFEIPASLDALPTARRRWRAFEEVLRGGNLPPDVHRALVALCRRTDRSNTWLGRLFRPLRRRQPR